MSTLKVNTLQNTSGVEVYTCKAWVNFNGQGTVSINASGNVSSVTDNGTGDYTLNFTNSMPDVNYAVMGNDQMPSKANYGNVYPGVQSTSSCRVFVNYTGTPYDAYEPQVAIFR